MKPFFLLTEGMFFISSCNNTKDNNTTVEKTDSTATAPSRLGNIDAKRSSAQSGTADSVVVNIEAGKVSGQLVNGDAIFKNIQFAASPFGKPTLTDPVCPRHITLPRI